MTVQYLHQMVDLGLCRCAVLIVGIAFAVQVLPLASRISDCHDALDSCLRQAAVLQFNVVSFANALNNNGEDIDVAEDHATVVLTRVEVERMVEDTAFIERVYEDMKNDHDMGV